MRPAQIAEAGRRLAERSRAAQGLPPVIADQVVLAAVAAVLQGVDRAEK